MSRSWFVMVAAIAASPAAAQFPPDSARNLKVLPADMPVRQVIGVMRGFAIGLGVRCEHCHVGEAGQPLSTFDFASDEKPAKEKARTMLRMVQAINDEWLAKLADRPTPKVEVQCVTCHRGQARPIMLEDELVHVVDSAGVDTAVAHYRTLRERFYGGFTYDFGPGPVNAAAGTLLRTDRPADAVALLALNREFHPDDAITIVFLGQAHAALGDTALAISELKQALELQPDNPAVRRLLARLQGGQ
jgi:tetratricopeptide (TPR) repeat protein